MLDDAPNLYSLLNLRRSDSCEELGVLLASRDVEREQMGYPATDPIRHQIRVACAILASPESRAVYDRALDQGKQVTWAEVETLARLGPLESENAPSYSPRPAPSPYGPGATGAGVGPNAAARKAGPWPAEPTAPGPGTAWAYDPFAAQAHSNLPAQRPPHELEAQHRPRSDTRFFMAIGDFILASSVAGGLSVPFFDEASGVVSFLLGTAFLAAYILGFETLAGGTPMKLLFSYEVRDVETKKKLSVAQSAKRNWWRLVQIVPGGGLITLIAGIHYYSTINELNELRGGHDDLAGAEVVKRRRGRGH